MSVMSTGRRPGTVVRPLSPGGSSALPRRPAPAGDTPTAGRRRSRPRLRLVPPLPGGPAHDRPPGAEPGREQPARPADRPPAVQPGREQPARSAGGRVPVVVPAQPASPAPVSTARAVSPAQPASPGRKPAGRVVRPAGRPGPAPGTAQAGTRAAAQPGRRPVRAAQPGRRPVRAGQVRPKVRLTRRGRIVLWALAALALAAVLTPVLLMAATGAQAANHGLPPAAVHQGLRHVVVHPGQTLWSIASAAEPAADPRIVIQEIMQVNALSNGVVVPGESLWVPAG